MSSFTITTPEASVNLRPSTVQKGQTAKGTATYSVTNRTGTTIRTRLRVDPGTGAKQEWFAVRDGDEREIAPGATTSFSVDINAPGGEGRPSFSAVAINIADSDNDYEAGAAIAFDAPKIEPEKTNGGIKWWMIAAPIALLLIVGGAIAAFVFWPDAKPPATVALADFRGTVLDAALTTLKDQGINNVSDSQRSPAEPEFGRLQFYDRIVVDQKPEPTEALEITASTSVELGWNWAPKKVTVPEIVNSAFAPAVAAIEGAGLKYVGAVGPFGNQPSDLHYPAVESVSPTGLQDAGTGITFTMKWQQGRRFSDVAIFQQQFELAKEAAVDRPETQINPERLRPLQQFQQPQ